MADEQTGAAIEDFLVEDRTFPPPESFKKDTLVASPFLYDEANEDWQGFWARQAADLLDWFEDWHTILEWELPFAKWFVGGKLNVCHNAVDRHVAAGRGDKVAYHWEGEPGDTRTITYADLHADVQRFANVLKGLGVAKGDRICIYMPMVPELPGGDAGLRPHRRAALGGVRRLQPRLAHRPHQRRRVQGGHHRRRRLPPRRAVDAQAQRRHRARRPRRASSTSSW